MGAAEVLARVRLLGAETLAPGEEGWLQLEMDDPVVAVRGDRYILRRPSPGETLGGGSVVDPRPKGRHKRFSAETLAHLETLSKGTPVELLLKALTASGPAPLREAVKRSNLDEETAALAVQAALQAGELVDLEERGQGLDIHSDGLAATVSTWNDLAARAQAEVDQYHRQFPLRPGMPREELKSRLKLPNRLFAAVAGRLVRLGSLIESGPTVRRPEHAIRLTPVQERQVEALVQRFKAAPYAPPTIKECVAEVGEELFNALVEQGKLVPIRSATGAPEVVFRREDYEAMVAEVRRLLEASGTITAAQVRDHFNTSRRYALALLEHLDTTGLTIREGDLRRLKS
jgi:selenocysteine-specific elongation factor